MEEWVCRCWKFVAGEGWTSEFEVFDTKEEAIQFGNLFMALTTFDECNRDFSIYRKESKYDSNISIDT